jgi:hypothetical protein
MNPRQRPFYFMIPFWGAAYREYFVDMCLPSLLAPHNFPILNADQGHRFLIATTKADWAAIENLPIIQTMRKHVTPVLLEIEPPGATPPGSSKAVWQQNYCQRLLVEAAYDARAIACMLWPDIILSDGMVSALQRWASLGHELVLFASLRHSREDVISELETRNILSPLEKHSFTCRPITISPRALADISVRNLHPEVTVFDVSDPRLPVVAPFIFFQVPGHGIIIHTFAGQPILMDFGAIDQHDTACLEEGTFENVYVDRNFPWRRTYVVQDSDEFGVLSLTPKTVGNLPVSADNNELPILTSLGLLCRLRFAMMEQTAHNRLRIRRDLFRLPIRWHKDDVDDVWRTKESELDTIVDRAVGDFYRTDNPISGSLLSSLNPWHFVGNLFRILYPVMPQLELIGKALTGDFGAIHQLKVKIQQRLATALR